MNSQLRCGDLLTQNDGEGWFVVVGVADGAYRVCRVPGGLLPKDYGTRFVHFPTPDDPSAYVLMAPCGERLHS